MQTIHDAAARGFQSAADAYERGRPEYPRESAEHLAHELGVGPGARVVDLAAGTGKFTRLLAPFGAEITAVEPVEAMRAKLAGLLPVERIFPGTAEAMPLEDGAYDAVISAQAFHWFDGPRALREIHRVLRPGGKLGLLWNVRNGSSATWVKRLSEIMNVHRKDTPQFRTGAWRRAFDESSLFGPLQEARFAYVQSGSIDVMVDRVTSVSFIAALPPAAHAEVERQVRELLATHPETRGHETLELPYITHVYWCVRL